MNRLLFAAGVAGIFATAIALSFALKAQIKLKDAGEPGTGDMYGIFIPAAPYASGDQPLEGGNVQIR